MTAKNNNKCWTTRKLYNWSQKYYKNLNKKQHLINNIWFNNILKHLKKDGFLYVPNINKSFNKNGQEIK